MIECIKRDSILLSRVHKCLLQILQQLLLHVLRLQHTKRFPGNHPSQGSHMTSQLGRILGGSFEPALLVRLGLETMSSLLHGTPMRISLTSSDIDILSTVWKALHIIAMTIFLRSVLRVARLVMKSPETGDLACHTEICNATRTYYRQECHNRICKDCAILSLKCIHTVWM